MPIYSSTKRSKYAWLYDNLFGCRGGDGVDYGCEVEDNKADYMPVCVENCGTIGKVDYYWTSTLDITNKRVWLIGSGGTLKSIGLTRGTGGIRPVITIFKSIIK